MTTKPVANFVLPIFASQDASTYKSNLDGGFAVAQRSIGNFAPHQSPQTADMTVTLDVGHIFNGSALSEVGADFSAGLSGTFTNGSMVVSAIPSTASLRTGMNIIIVSGGAYQNFLPANTTISSVDSGTQIHISGNFTNTTGSYSFIALPKSATITAPATNPRIDRIAIDKITGVVVVVGGTEAASPVPPAIPAYCCPVAQVLLQTTSTTILNSMIADERDFSGLGGASGVIVGGCRNLVVKQTGNATATIAADELVVKSALGGGALTLSGVSLTLNAAGTGANGLDTGALANSTFYYLYAIYNPSSRTVAALATTAGSGSSVYSGSSMPAGYTLSALTGVLLTDGSAHFLATTQYDREVFYQTPQAIFSSQANVAALTSQSISAAVPPCAKTASGFLFEVPLAAVTNKAQVAGDGTGYGRQDSAIITTTTIAGLADIFVSYRQLPLITAQTLYWNVGNTGGSTSSLDVTSYTI